MVSPLSAMLRFHQNSYNGSDAVCHEPEECEIKSVENKRRRCQTCSKLLCLRTNALKDHRHQLRDWDVLRPDPRPGKHATVCTDIQGDQWQRVCCQRKITVVNTVERRNNVFLHSKGYQCLDTMDDTTTKIVLHGLCIPQHEGEATFVGIKFVCSFHVMLKKCSRTYVDSEDVVPSWNYDSSNYS